MNQSNEKLDPKAKSYLISSFVRLGIVYFVVIPLSGIISYYFAKSIMPIAKSLPGAWALLSLGLMLVAGLLFFFCFLLGGRLVFATLRCPVCSRRPGELFDQGGKCQQCQALLTVDPLCRARSIALTASPQEKARIEKEFKTQLRNGNRYFLLLISILMISIISAFVFNNALLSFIGIALFILGTILRLRLAKKIVCPACGADPQRQPGTMYRQGLHFGCCNQCGAQLVKRNRILRIT